MGATNLLPCETGEQIRGNCPGLVLVPAAVIPLVVSAGALVVVIALVVVVPTLVVVPAGLRITRLIASAVRATTGASLLLTALADLVHVLCMRLPAVVAAVGMGRSAAALRPCGAGDGQKHSGHEYEKANQ